MVIISQHRLINNMLLQFSTLKKLVNILAVTSLVVLAGSYTPSQAAPYDQLLDEGRVSFFKVVKVRANDVLNLRQSPNSSSKKVGKIPAAQKCVAYLNQKKKQWVKVTYRGVQGWANLRYLSLQDRGCGTFYLVKGVADNLNLRQSPNGSSKKVGKISAQEQNCILGLDKKNQWVMLHYQGVKGWANSRYLKTVDVDDCDI
jgi:uncharacterized protein YgiM (DUF1202 family)